MFSRVKSEALFGSLVEQLGKVAACRQGFYKRALALALADVV